MEEKKIIYLDNSATTRPSDASLTKMREALSVYFANPGSVHLAGNEAHRLLERARETVGLTLGVRRASDGRIIFTSSGSEANNLAIFGSVYAKECPHTPNGRGMVMITDSEHPSVSECALRLERDGFRVVRVPTRGGDLDIDFIKRECGADCILASFMLVNNETGAVYNVAQAAKAVRERAPKAFIHSDCVQGYLKLKLTPKTLGVDALTVSAHKVNAPKGAAALYVSAEVIQAKRLVGITLGGGQELGFRSGTENLPAICAFAKAAEEGFAELGQRAARARELRQLLEKELDSRIIINRPKVFLDNIISMTLPKIKSETMLNFLSGKGICVSAGSACAARKNTVSSALISFGLDPALADSTLRVSLGHENTEEDILALCRALTEGVDSLAKIK